MTTSLPASSPGFPASTGIRRTTPRDPNRPDLTSSYTALSRTIKESGLLRRTRGFYIAMFSGLTLALVGAGAGFVLLGDTWYQLLIAGAVAVLLTQFAFLAHEAAHRQVFDSNRVNDRLGRFVASGLVGMSYQWWMSKHTRHHANPNRLTKDPDINDDTVSFTVESATERRGAGAWLVRHQGVLFLPLLLLEGLNLHYLSLKSLLRRGHVEGRWIELGMIAGRFGLYLTVLFLFLPVGMAFAFLGVQLAVFGFYMGISFAPNHIGMAVVAKDAKLDFLSKQVLTSRNISGGFWSTVLMGGLNYQVEHHLFPSMPRPHLARANAIVREHCAKLQVPYTETTFAQGVAAVVAHMNKVGLSAPDTFTCPLVKARY